MEKEVNTPRRSAENNLKLGWRCAVHAGLLTAASNCRVFMYSPRVDEYVFICRRVLTNVLRANQRRLYHAARYF